MSKKHKLHKQSFAPTKTHIPWSEQSLQRLETRESPLPFARARLLNTLRGVFDNFNPERSFLREVEDLRTFRIRPRRPSLPAETEYRNFDSSRARAAYMASSGQVYGLPEAVRLQFRLPRSAVVCYRRQLRRSVLFSLHKTGRGARKKKASWSEHSYIQCRKLR